MDIFAWHLACAGPMSPTSPWRDAFISTVQNRTGNAFDLDSFAESVAVDYNAQHSKRLSRALEPKWPAIGLTRLCTEHYESHHLYSIFPLVEVSHLKALVNKYDSNSLHQRENTLVLALLAAFTAFMTQIHRHLPAFADAEPDCYILAALTLLPQIMLKPRSIEGLQAVVIMVEPLPIPVNNPPLTV